MCGYCTEQFVFIALHDSSYPSELPEAQIIMDVYLEGVQDISSALQKFSSQCVTIPSVALVILCHAIDLLVVHGFESDAYQELLQQPQFISAISVACTESAEAALNDFDVRLKVSDFAWLAKKDSYLVPGCFAQHSNASGDKTGISLLNDYIAWWLEGGSVPHQDLGQMMEDTGIMNPIEDIPISERLLLKHQFPALWFALLRTSRLPVGMKILWTIISRNPAGIPDFSGLDLWLQRRAVLAVYDQQGLDPFLSESQPVRAELFQYLVATRICKAEEKNALLAALDGREGFFSGTADKWQWADAQQCIKPTTPT